LVIDRLRCAVSGSRCAAFSSTSILCSSSSSCTWPLASTPESRSHGSSVAAWPRVWPLPPPKCAPKCAPPCRLLSVLDGSGGSFFSDGGVGPPLPLPPALPPTAAAPPPPTALCEPASSFRRYSDARARKESDCIMPLVPSALPAAFDGRRTRTVGHRCLPSPAPLNEIPLPLAGAAAAPPSSSGLSRSGDWLFELRISATADAASSWLSGRDAVRESL